MCQGALRLCRPCKETEVKKAFPINFLEAGASLLRSCRLRCHSVSVVSGKSGRNLRESER